MPYVPHVIPDDSASSSYVDEIARLEHMSVSYGQRHVLSNVSLSINQGKFFAVIGPNGAGKSSLLGLFNGMTPAASGKAFFKGTEVSGAYTRQARLCIAHVFQASDLDSRMPLTVYEAVLGGTCGRLGLFHRPGRHERQLVSESLAKVGLSVLAGRPIGQLSGGERQRVSLARALAQKPELLLLDEPTAALDWQAQREILTYVAGLRASGLTIVMVTHDLNAVFAMATDVIMVKEGRILASLPVSEAADAGLLSELYGVRVKIIDNGGRPAVLF